MIIECTSCNKKFEINSSLIPNNGRTIQCGSCNHIWFYISDLKIPSNISPSKSLEKNNILKKKNEKEIEFINLQNQQEISIKERKFIDKDITQKKIANKKNNFNFGKLLSYFLVLITSFIALIIILDTFKSPLNNFFPGVELLLYNLFETIKDIYLFLKNLLI